MNQEGKNQEGKTPVVGEAHRTIFGLTPDFDKKKKKKEKKKKNDDDDDDDDDDG